MRLLLASPNVDHLGGVARSVRRIARSLSDAGHTVTVCSPDDDLFPGEARQDASAYRYGPRVRTLDGACAEQVEALVAAASGCRPDAIVGFYATTSGRAATRAASALDVASVVCLRGNDVDADLDDEVRAPAAREAIANATRLTAVSREMCEKVRGATGMTATFVTNAVDTQHFRPAPAKGAALRAPLGFSERPVVGLFGEIKDKRGLARLSSIAGFSAVDLLVVGHLRPEIRGDLPKNARLVETIEDDEGLCAAYSACDAVIQPSRSDGMPNVILEAMACGRPVIVSAVGGLVDLVTHGETGWLCRSDADWAEAFGRLRAGHLGSLGPRARASVPRPEVERDAVASVIQDAIVRYAASKAPR